MAVSTKQDQYHWDRFAYDAWSSDNGLRRCSFAAKGLWMDMLAIMWNEPLRGSMPGSPSAVAALVRAEVDEIKPLLHELKKAGVFSVAKDVAAHWPEVPAGYIVNRRMFRTHRTLRARAAAGRAGGLASGAARSKEQVGLKQKPSKDQPHTRQKTSANIREYEAADEAKPKQKRNGGGAEVSEILGEVLPDLGRRGDPVLLRRNVAERACRVHRANSAQIAWWSQSIDLLALDDVLEFEQRLAHAEESQRGTRPDKGALANPGGYLVNQLYVIARSAGVRVETCPRSAE